MKKWIAITCIFPILSACTATEPYNGANEEASAVVLKGMLPEGDGTSEKKSVCKIIIPDSFSKRLLVKNLPRPKIVKKCNMIHRKDWNEQEEASSSQKNYVINDILWEDDQVAIIEAGYAIYSAYSTFKARAKRKGQDWTIVDTFDQIDADGAGHVGLPNFN